MTFGADAKPNPPASRTASTSAGNFPGSARTFGANDITSCLSNLSSTITAPSHKGSNMFDALSVENIQQIATCLDVQSLKSFRSTGRLIKSATSYVFAHACLSSMLIRVTSLEFQRSLTHLRSTQWAGTALKTITFTGSAAATKASIGHMTSSGIDMPNRQDAAELFVVASNPVSIRIREGKMPSLHRAQKCYAGVDFPLPLRDRDRHTTAHSVATPVLQALSTAACTTLTELSLDNTAFQSETLMAALDASASSLAYLSLRNVTLTAGTVSSVLVLVESDLCLSRLLLNSLVANETVYKLAPQAMLLLNPDTSEWGTLNFRTLSEDGTEQSWMVGECYGSMSGTFGVKWGIEAILGWDMWRE